MGGTLKASDRAYVNAIRSALPNNFPSVLEDVILSYANEVTIALHSAIVRGVKILRYVFMTYDRFTIKEAMDHMESRGIESKYYNDVVVKNMYYEQEFTGFWREAFSDDPFDDHMDELVPNAKYMSKTEIKFASKPRKYRLIRVKKASRYYEHSHNFVEASKELMRTLYWNNSGYWDSIPRISP